MLQIAFVCPSCFTLFHFLPKWALKFDKIPDSGYPLSKWNGVIYREELCPLLLKCFVSFLRCTRNVAWAPGRIYKSLTIHFVSFFAKADSLIAHYQMPHLGYPLRIWNEILCCKRKHTLLMKCFKTYLIFIRRMGGAWVSIYMPHMAHTVSFFTKVGTQIWHKMPELGYPLSKWNGVIYHKERYPLLLKCFIPFLRCMKNMGGKSGRIYASLMVYTISFLPRPTL